MRSRSISTTFHLRSESKPEDRLSEGSSQVKFKTEGFECPKPYEAATTATCKAVRNTVR